LLTSNQLRKVAARTGARDLSKVEIDVILTMLLQMFEERGVLPHVAFKGGTMLRKVVFGSRGRLSTDLDFTLNSALAPDDFTLLLVSAFDAPFRGLDFDIGDRKSWYLVDNGCGATPIVRHEDNPVGVAIKLEVSMREKPFLPVERRPQLPHVAFGMLGFEPVEVPSLAYEEALAEKIRAASQRWKIRDLYDLSESLSRPFNQPLVRRLAVLKLRSQGDVLDYGHLTERIRHPSYDVSDLLNLLRKDQRPDLDQLIDRVTRGFRFLADLDEIERLAVADQYGRQPELTDQLLRQLVTNTQAGPL